jgi:WD40 repeat protein
VKTGERVQTLAYSDPINRPPTGIADFGFGPEGSFLTRTALGRLDLWDLDTAAFRSLTEERGPYRYFVLSPDRSLMALGSVFIDNLTLAVSQDLEIKAIGVEIWDTKIWKLQRTLADANPPYAFGPDGKTLATLSGVSFMISITDPGPPVIWQLATGERRELSVKGFPLNLGYSPDGKTLAIYTQPIGSSGIVGTLLLSTEDGQVKQTIPGVPAVFFSPDGSLVAGVDYNEISLWDVQTGNRIVTLPGGALDIGFSPDGILLTAVSGSGCITLWNVDALVHN